MQTDCTYHLEVFFHGCITLWHNNIANKCSQYYNWDHLFFAILHYHCIIIIENGQISLIYKNSENKYHLYVCMFACFYTCMCVRIYQQNNLITQMIPLNVCEINCFWFKNANFSDITILSAIKAMQTMLVWIEQKRKWTKSNVWMRSFHIYDLQNFVP